jgi:type IV pilus assembly protein PilE
MCRFRARLAVRGFTLVELLTATAIAAVFAAVAVPTYQSQVAQARRADAAAALLRLELAQAGYRANHGLYTADLRALGPRTAASDAGRYRLEIAEVHADGYLARAVPVDAAVRRSDVHCAVLTLEVHGLHTRRGPSDRCWVP